MLITVLLLASGGALLLAGLYIKTLQEKRASQVSGCQGQVQNTGQGLDPGSWWSKFILLVTAQSEEFYAIVF